MARSAVMRPLHTSRRHAAGPHVEVLLLLAPHLLQLVRLRGFAGAEMSGRQEMQMSVAQWPLRLRGGGTGVQNQSRAPGFRHAAPSGPMSMPSSRLWPPERFGEDANASTPSASARRNPYDVQPQRLRQRELDDAGQFSQRHTDYVCWGSQKSHAHASQGFACERASGTEVFERRQVRHGYGNGQGTVRDREFVTPRLFSRETRARMQQREMLERRGSGRGIYETDNYETDRTVPRRGARVHDLLRRRLPSAPRPRQTTYPTRQEPRDEQRWEWDDESRHAESGSEARRGLSHSFGHIPQHACPQPRLHDRSVRLGPRNWQDAGEGPRGWGQEPNFARYGGEELTRTRGCGGDPRMSSRVHERGREPRAGSWQLTDGNAHFTRPSGDRDGDGRRGRFGLAGLPLLPHPVSSVEAAHSCTKVKRRQHGGDQQRHSPEQTPTVESHTVPAVGVPLTGTQTLVAAAGLSANASRHETVKSWPDVASATSTSVSASLRCSRATAGADEDKVAAMFNWDGLEVGSNAARPADNEAASTGQANYFAGGMHVTDDFLGAFGASVTQDQAENKADEKAAAKGLMDQVLRNESEWSDRGVESSSGSSSMSSGQSWAAGSGIKDLGGIKDLSSTVSSDPALGSDQAIASMTPDLPESLDLSKHSLPDTTPVHLLPSAVSRPDGWQPASQASLDASRGVRVSGETECALESFNRKRDIGGVGQEKYRDGRSDSLHAACTSPPLALLAPRSRGISPQAASKVARSVGQGISTDSEASVHTRESDVGVARERARSMREQAARAQDKTFFKNKWKTYRHVILNDRDGGGTGGIDGWTRSSADEKGTLHADASEEDSADGWARMCRLLLMPDSSESDYDEQMADIQAMFDEDRRFGTGWRGWERREAEEQRLFARRCRDLRYVRLGDYWLDDWSGSSRMAQTDHRTLMPASRKGDSSRSAADQGTESRVSSLTRHATSLIYGSIIADGLRKTEPTEEALDQAENALETAIKESQGRFSPALNNLGALFAYRASCLANSSNVNVDPRPPAPAKSNLKRPGEERGHRSCKSETGTKCDHSGNMDGHASSASEIGKDEIDSDIAVLFDVPRCSASEENFAIDEPGERRLATLDTKHLLGLQEENRVVALESWARQHGIQIPWQPLDQGADGGALMGKAAGGEDDEVTDSSEEESCQEESGGNGKTGEGEKRSRSHKAMTLSLRATDLLRTAMEQTPRYVTAMCNMAHLLSLNASTYLEAGMLHLQAREFAGVERVVDWWDPLPHSAPETVQGKGMDWPLETKASVHGHVFQPLEALNLHMEQVSLRMDEAIDAEERAREQDLDALSSDKDIAEEWGAADGPSGLVRSKAIELTRRALAAAETADVDFWKSKVQGDDDSEFCSS